MTLHPEGGSHRTVSDPSTAVALLTEQCLPAPEQNEQSCVLVKAPQQAQSWQSGESNSRSTQGVQSEAGGDESTDRARRKAVA